MPRYKVTTPQTPRITFHGVSSADFAQATQCESPACVRRLLEPWKFNGCAVWRRNKNHWSLIFDTTGPQGDYSDPPAAWARVEASQ